MADRWRYPQQPSRIKLFHRHADAFLGQMPEKLKFSLKPDLLITFGKSLVAKNLKLFLREYAPREHWHLQTGGDVADTFQSLTQIIPVRPDYFFAELTRRSTENWFRAASIPMNGNSMKARPATVSTNSSINTKRASLPWYEISSKRFRNIAISIWPTV